MNENKSDDDTNNELVTNITDNEIDNDSECEKGNCRNKKWVVIGVGLPNTYDIDEK